MKINLLYTSILLVIFAFTGDTIPDGWIKAGSDPDKYDMGLDSIICKTGKSSAYIKSIQEISQGYGTLMQRASAEKFIGKRIRMTGQMKSHKVSTACAFWLRVDDLKGDIMSFDNMRKRSIKGDTDWTEYSIVLNVPENSYSLNFGALLSGTGHIWFDDIHFEEVSIETPVTSIPRFPDPSNLGFED